MSKPQEERKLYGLNACQSFFRRFPDRIVRAWLMEDVAKHPFAPLMKWMAQEKRPYHLADRAELERVTQSEHHEGICLQVVDYPPFELDAFLATLPPGKPVCLLALDGVSNPHNLGAIMRVAAHYGVGAILGEQVALLRSGAAVRTAEGGATYAKLVATDNLAKSLQVLKRRQFTVIATSSHESQSLYDAALPERVVLVLGEEKQGVSQRILQLADARVAISGTGWVESLNVGVATGIFLSEFWRQHRITPGTTELTTSPTALSTPRQTTRPTSPSAARAKPAHSRKPARKPTPKPTRKPAQ